MPQYGFADLTNVILSCKNYEDDNTPVEALRYKFTYLKWNSPNIELVIQDYSQYNEAAFKFPIPPDHTSFNYTILCYSKDLYEASNSSTNWAMIYANTTSTTISISKMLENNDITSDLEPSQLYLRSLMLKSIGESFFSPSIFNRTLINSTADGSSLLLSDPVCSDAYCNYRGSCALVDKFLTCACINYVGSTCQIDVGSYDMLSSLYRTLYSLLQETLTVDSVGYVVDGFGNLMYGASYFLDDADYLLQVYDFILIAQKFYPGTLLYKSEYFDYFNDMLEWGLSK